MPRDDENFPIKFIPRTTSFAHTLHSREVGHAIATCVNGAGNFLALFPIFVSAINDLVATTKDLVATASLLQSAIFSLMPYHDPIALERFLRVDDTRIGAIAQKINIEVKLDPGQTSNLKEFVDHLSLTMHSSVLGSLVLWYDSVTNDDWESNYKNISLASENVLIHVVLEGVPHAIPKNAPVEVPSASSDLKHLEQRDDNLLVEIKLPVKYILSRELQLNIDKVAELTLT